MSALGDIARRGMGLSWLNGQERSVLSHMADCKTERLGGNVLSCTCGHREVHYNSCRDRHCPLCQGGARARWVRARLGELVPCGYFHVVFTVPHELNYLALSNRHAFYRALFLSVHETLLDVCANPANLGARVGGMSILHTWNQKLAFHPHIHCIVPTGGISPDFSRWIAGNPTYLVSVKRLSAVFRGKLMSRLGQSIVRNELCGDGSALRDAVCTAARKDFVVYAKPPFGSPSQVIKYLGRYTHRVGISEQRIVCATQERVCFSWIDRAAGHAKLVMSLSCDEFIRKFTLHILPKGLRKIRYFGFMGNRNRTASIARVRALIAFSFDSLPNRSETDESPAHRSAMESPRSEPVTASLCLRCGLPLIVLHQIGVSSSGQHWLTSRLAFLREVHGPEPNGAVFA